ncbi:MAG: hypothetical protein C0468_03435 [Planctomyces sp.]|nr:hypothetical protein [Planctomyces sp.]
MKVDHLSYVRATRVALMGLALQLSLGIGLLLYGVLGRDHAALSGAGLVLLGSAAWLVLAVVLDQHRRERLEDMEARALDAGARTSAFEGSAEDLRVQAKRLAWMHSVLVPVSSMLLSAGLIALGMSRALSGQRLLTPNESGVEEFRVPGDRGWAMAVAVACAAVGFVFARFVSGMAKQRVWANLRGGAGYAVAASLIGVALMAAQLVHLAGSDVALRWALVVVPAFSVLLGVEIVLSFLLNLYRPRKGGEVPRAAFDSPILGFVASPDQIAKTIGGAISYQIGIDVTGTWAYQLVSRAVVPLVVFGAVVLWLLTSLAVVGGTERGLLMRNGRLVGVIEPGLHLKLPWPVDEVRLVEASTVREVALGNSRPLAESRVILWTGTHHSNEEYFVVRALDLRGLGSASGRAGRSGAAAGGGAIDAEVSRARQNTGDLALLSVEVPVTYRVTDAGLYETFAAPEDRQALLKVVGQRQVTRILARYEEDEILGPKRLEIGQEIESAVRAAIDRLGAGVEVLSCRIEGVHPPAGAPAEAFEKAMGDPQRGLSLIEGGRARAIGLLTRVAGDYALAERIIAQLRRRNSLREEFAAAADPAQRAQLEGQIAQLELEIEGQIAASRGEAGAMIASAQAGRWARLLGVRAQAQAFDGLVESYLANPALFKARVWFEALSDRLKDSRLYVVDGSVPDLRVTYDLKETGAGAARLDQSTTPTGTERPGAR